MYLKKRTLTLITTLFLLTLTNVVFSQSTTLVARDDTYSIGINSSVYSSNLLENDTLASGDNTPILKGFPTHGQAFLSQPHTSTPTITIATNNGNYTEIRQVTAQSINGIPSVAWVVSWPNSLREDQIYFASATDNTGSTWNTPTQVQAIPQERWTVFSLSLTAINNKPSISYYDNNKKQVIYISASNAEGSAWNDPVIVDSNINIFAEDSDYTDLSEVDDLPAIVYFDNESKNIYYRIANSIEGTSWKPPVILDTFTVGNFAYPSLEIVDNHPAVSFYDAQNQNLAYIRASDQTGDSWGTKQTIATDYNTGKFTFLKVVDNNPAIVYVEERSDESTVKFIRATDSIGQNWSQAKDITNYHAVQNFKIIDGKPHIIAGGYFESIDATGEYWLPELQTPRILVDANNNAGFISYSSGWVSQTDYIFFSEIESREQSYTFAYQPDVGFCGSDSLSYFIQNNTAISNTATISIEVECPTLTAIDDYLYLTDDNTGYNFRDYRIVTNNDKGQHVDLKNVSTIIAAVPEHGKLYYTSYGSQQDEINVGDFIQYGSDVHEQYDPDFVYQADPDFCGLDSFQYYLEASEPTSLTSNTATAYLYVPCPSQILTPHNDSFETSMGSDFNTAVTTLLNNDDFPGFVRDIQFSIDQHPANGTVQIEAQWTPISVDDGASTVSADTGKHTSIAINSSGLPTIAYFDETNGNLMFAHAKNNEGTAWNPPIVVDDSGTVGRYNSLTYIDGKPAISYFDSTNLSLKYIRSDRANGTSWNTPAVTIPNLSNDAGLFTSLIELGGKPAISFYDAENDNLMFVRGADVNGTYWDHPRIVDSVGDTGLESSLVTVNGRPAISYYDATSQNLTYVRANDAAGVSWQVPQDLTSGSESRKPSMLIVNGKPAISFYQVTDASTKSLKFIQSADENGDTWQAAQTLDSLTGTDIGDYNDLAIINDRPAISYFDRTNADLKFIKALDPDGQNWDTPEIVDTIIGAFSSLTQLNDKPVISYYNGPSNGLFFATHRYIDVTYTPEPSFCGTDSFTYKLSSLTASNVVSSPATVIIDVNCELEATNDTYTTEPNESLTVSGKGMLDNDTAPTNIQLDITDNPAHGTVQFNDPQNVSSSFTLATNYSGDYTSFTLVNEKPAVSYYDTQTKDLIYRYALDAKGNAWSDAISIDTDGDVGQYNSLAIINDVPAISYYDATNGDLKYVQATNSEGSAWGTPITVDSEGTVGSYTALTTIQGVPAISYYDADNNQLKFVHALNENGAIWQTPTTISTNDNAGQFSTMHEVSGFPQIIHYNSRIGQVIHTRGFSNNSTTYNTRYKFNSTSKNVSTSSGGKGKNVDSAIINGVPAVSYYDQSITALVFQSAIDSSGSSWQTGVIIDTVFDVGDYSSLTSINSRPAISYFNRTDGDLMYVEAKDSDGTEWRAPIVVQSEGDVGSFSELLEVDGRPAFSYFDASEQALKYIRLEQNIADGGFTYTPNSDFCGTDSFTYTLTDDSGNSDTASVTIEIACVETSVPSTPILNCVTNTTDKTPILSWQTSATATNYHLIVEDINNPTPPIVNTYGVTLTDIDYSIGSELGNGTYRWRVRAQNSAGWSDWSANCTMTIEDEASAVPDTPSLTCTSRTAEQTPVLDWSDTAGATNYHLVFESVENPSPPIVNTFGTPLPTSAHTITSALPEGTYRWRVRAQNSLGWSEWSVTCTMTIGDEPMFRVFIPIIIR